MKQGRRPTDAYPRVRYNADGSIVGADGTVDLTTSPNVAVLQTRKNATSLKHYYQIKTGASGIPEDIVGAERTTVYTQNNTVTTALTRTIPAGQAWLVIVKASANNNADTNRAAYWKAALVYRPAGGSATRQGSVASVIPDIESDTGWGGVNITVSGNDVLATVQGKTGVNINWRVSMEVLPNTE